MTRCRTSGPARSSISSFYFANLGGGIRSTANLVKLGELCEWFQCDNQGRGGDDTPIWECTLQGRVCNAVQSGKMATNVTGAWSTGAVRWRNVYKSPQEAQMWMNETLASGMVPYHHIVGGENGMGEDRRGLEPARQYFNWMARHDAHFINKRSIASIGVVMGQRTHLFYTPPRGSLMRQYTDGRYTALLEGRFLFDFVHEDKLAAQELAKYSALLLPNTALLSDEQCRQLRAYVDAGGSLLATFQTSLVHRAQRAPCGLRSGRRAGHSPGRRCHRDDGQRVSGAHRETARDPERLCRDALDPRRREPGTHRAGRGTRPDGRTGLHGVPT